ncbi:MAG: isoprenylcysteine carboxylmethyltransferase family protein [bacterium]
MREGEHPAGDVGQWICVVVFLAVWVGDSFVLHVSTFLAHLVPLPVRLVLLGFALVTAGYLFKSGHVVVSHDHPPDAVLHSGAFRYVRHPLYLASLLVYLGVAVSTLSLLSLGLLVGIFVFHNYIAGYEERLLLARFGEAYRGYQRSAGKWVPRIGGNG